VETVLGLSMTSTSVGWVLVDGRDADGATVDHDAFDVGADEGSTAEGTSQPAVAMRGAHAIAAASGHEVRTIGVTWSDDVEKEATRLLKSLTTAVCLIEPEAVTVLTVDTGDRAVHTDVTRTRESSSADGLSQWLTAVFDRNDRQPDSLLLVGARTELDAITAALDEALSMPVVASADAQLVLARGAALALAKNADATDAHAGKGQADARPANGQSRLASHTRALTMSGAAVVAAGIALFAAGSQFPDKVSRPAENLPTAAASVTPASAHLVPPPVSAPAPPLQPLAAEPPRRQSQRPNRL
jgi:hypothetical protein